MLPTWQTDDGSVRLYCGDCLEVLPHIEPVDAVLTDPPYSSGGMVRGDRMNSTRNKYQSSDVNFEHPEFTGDNRDQRGFLAWCTLWLIKALEITKPGGVAVLFTDWRQLPTTTDALQAGGYVWRGIVPWDKQNARPMPNRFTSQCEYAVWGTNGPRDFDTTNATYHPGILRENAPSTSERVHATQKPVGVMQELCLIAPAGGVVLDPFMGSATTGVGCINSGRRFVGIEKSPQIFEIAKNRIVEELAKTRLIDAAVPRQVDLFKEAVEC